MHEVRRRQWSGFEHYWLTRAEMCCIWCQLCSGIRPAEHQNNREQSVTTDQHHSPSLQVKKSLIQFSLYYYSRCHHFIALSFLRPLPPFYFRFVPGLKCKFNDSRIIPTPEWRLPNFGGRWFELSSIFTRSSEKWPTSIRARCNWAGNPSAWKTA